MLCFVTALGLSALGALPVGLINLSIANWTIKKGRKAGTMASFGATSVEFAYTFLAVYFIDILNTNATLERCIQFFSIVVFATLALFYFRKSRKDEVVDTKIDKGSRRSFWYGAGITSINLLIIPYWIFLTIWLKSNGYVIDHIREIVSIALGSAIGAGLIFIAYVHLGSYIVRRVAHVNRHTNRVLSVLFAVLGLVQLIRILF